MKMLFKTTLTAIVLMLSMTNFADAQNIYAANSHNSGPDTEAATVTVVTKTNDEAVTDDNAASVAILESNFKLKERFSALYPTAEKQRWGMVESCYYVSFLSNGRKSRASFTQKGVMTYAITDCTMEQLPTVLRTILCKKYPGYKLLNGIEISAYNEIGYQVVLENETGYITLKSDGEDIEKIQETRKSN